MLPIMWNRTNPAPSKPVTIMTIFKEIVEVRALTNRSKGGPLDWLALLILTVLAGCWGPRPRDARRRRTNTFKRFRAASERSIGPRSAGAQRFTARERRCPRRASGYPRREPRASGASGASLMDGRRIRRDPAELEVAEHAGIVCGHADHRVARALALSGRAHAVGAGEVVDQQRVRALFGDQRVDAREVAALAGERAAIAVAADQQAALQLFAVDLELAGLIRLVAPTAAVGVACAAALGRAQAQEPPRLGPD